VITEVCEQIQYEISQVSIVSVGLFNQYKKEGRSISNFASKFVRLRIPIRALPPSEQNMQKNGGQGELKNLTIAPI
jgi:hypothetical protein